METDQFQLQFQTHASSTHHAAMTKGRNAIPRQSLDALLDRFFFCPSCTTWRTTERLRPATAPRPFRYASTLSSTTAVNATKNIPPRYQALYKALTDVRKKASAHVNLSRLHLALQGLESENPVTRVAVLGLNVPDTARRIVRLLLADALKDEERWEKQLLGKDENYDQGILIRYGHPPNPNLPPPRTSTPVIYIPASVLENTNIEILVSSISGPDLGELGQKTQNTPSDAFLSPSIGTPTAASGRQTVIAQPVHQCLLVAEELRELVSSAELLASTKFSSSEDRQSINVAVNLENAHINSPGEILVVDATKAERGLAAIRRSLGEATTYEHDWLQSGMPSLSRWLTLASASHSHTRIPSPVQMLILSLLNIADRNIQAQETLSAQSSARRSLSLAARSNLEAAIEDFSRRAHQELQSGLASAWETRNWRKLSWYKLFWRVDDVGLIITDLVTNAWLPRTERAVYELSGRLTQAGVSPVDAPQPPSQVEASFVSDARGKAVPILPAPLQVANEPALEPVVVHQAGRAGGAMAPVPPPLEPARLASSISKTRASQIERAILDLTATAQQIVLRTLSITGLTAGLSGLTYLSLTPGSVYEAGTIVALGTAYALRRMQGDWQKTTKAFEERLYDQGRDVIRTIVESMKVLVDQASQVREDEVEVQALREAQAAVDRAREELNRLP